MGDFQLGCVLGQYDKAQSFDVNSSALVVGSKVGSWSILGGATVTKREFVTETHSSNQGLSFSIESAGTNFETLKYDSAVSNDLFSKWFPDVTTHARHIGFWARMTTEAGSGRVFHDYANIPGDNDLNISYSETLQYYSNVTIQVNSSTSAPAIARLVGRSATDSAVVVTDDWIHQIDLVTVHPGYSMEDKARLRQSNHTTLAGNRHQYTWNKTFEWSVPLSFLSDSHADLINWWWQNQFILAWTLDTSDSESTFLARIGNARQPIGARRRSDNKLFEGMLQLEAVTDGRLVF
jgi:hypothetical protein